MWSLPGYAVIAPIGSGSSGEVYLAREEATGAQVALKRLTAGGDLAALRREAARLAEFVDPSVIRLREVRSAPDGRGIVLVLDYAAGGSLAEVVMRRGALPPGRVVRMIAALGQALVAAHGVGLLHGAITPGNVLFADDGRPLLAHLGIAELTDRDAATSDVYGLASVAVFALTGRPVAELTEPEDSALDSLGPPLRTMLMRACSAEMADRPSMAELVQAAVDGADVAVDGAVVPGGGTARGDGAAVPGERARPIRLGELVVQGKRLLRQWPDLTRLALIVTVVALAVAGGFAWTAIDRTSSSGAPDGAIDVPSRASTNVAEWTEVVTALDHRRGEAFSRPDAGLLQDIYTSDSPARSADTEQIGTLVSQQHRAAGVQHDITVLAVVATAETSATLRMRDTLHEYSIMDANGTVLSTVPAGTARELLITLERDGDPATGKDGWRIVRLDPA